MPTKSFKIFLQENLSWSDFENLHDHLGQQRRGTTLLIENPRKGEKLQGEKIAALLQKWNKKYDAAYLAKEFHFGVSE